MRPGAANVAQLAEFDEVIDARTPAEYADDHIPGAINCPVLDDEQRAEIGTLYKQVSPFVARKRGAALVARNIADHLLERFQDRPRNWRPLIYCWRGGQRSGAFVTIFRQVGWDACQLEGGYKGWRRHVMDELVRLSPIPDYRIVCGATGSGKTRLLSALAAEGAQVLDLEALAAHKGSLLGDLPGDPQPSQRMFDSRLFSALSALDPARPVYAEAESRRIGRVELPTALLERLRASPCLALEASREARVDYLLEDYAYFLADPAPLLEKLAVLKEVRGSEAIAHWCGLAAAGAWRELVQDLLDKHYDPLYHRSQDQNFANFPNAPRYAAADLSLETLRRIAGEILARNNA
ncbi:MAG: tRNA 2-selenouridine(34) synthase MnmH [Rhodocyclaceae bacterium]|nr:tRNA 2-selenouridine(34) synthase MnmH [Rhodocyclaceae bacterium]